MATASPEREIRIYLKKKYIDNFWGRLDAFGTFDWAKLATSPHFKCFPIHQQLEKLVTRQYPH